MKAAVRWLVFILVVFTSATYGKGGGGGGGHSSGGGGGHASSGGSHASVAKSAPARVTPAAVSTPHTWFPFFGHTGSTEDERKKKETK